MQTVIVLLIVTACALLIGRRFYKNLKRTKPGSGSGCGCDCSGCGPDIPAACHPGQDSDTSPKNPAT